MEILGKHISHGGRIHSVNHIQSAVDIILLTAVAAATLRASVLEHEYTMSCGRPQLTAKALRPSAPLAKSSSRKSGREAN